MDLCNPAVIRSLMEEAGIAPRKEYGQNFLVNASVPENIAAACRDGSEAMILEIGPGIGCLTAALCRRYRRVVALEIDGGLLPVLSKSLAEFDNVTVLHADVMQTDLAAVVREYAGALPVSVCANLPYYITTPILMRLLECGVPFSTVTVMVQKEVADRLIAAPGSRDYGAITAALGYYGVARRLFRVSAGSFLPAPKVDSAVVRIDLYREPPYRPQNEPLFRGLIRAAFGTRRKTLPNAVTAAYPEFSKAQVADALAMMGLDANVRGECLSTADFVRLSDLLSGASSVPAGKDSGGEN